MPERLVPIAANVWMIPAASVRSTPENRGRSINIGVAMGVDGAVVIDSGSNLATGRAVLALVESQLERRVRWVVNTHAHPENVLGNAGLTERGAQAIAHPETSRLMRERCPECQKNFAQRLGLSNEPSAVIPTPFLAQDTARFQGNLHWLVATGGHLPGSVAVFDATSGVLFAGGAVVNQVIPDVAEADIAAWIDTLSRWERTLAIVRVLPDRGEPGSASLLRETRAYLQTLLDETQSAYDDGVDLSDVAQRVRAVAFAGWALYDELHAANVRAVFRKIESDDLRQSKAK
jgi:glyoxylase-like metal-dependent hydrolase (beta-lactamase superfamily II)